jgi:aryl-alcohol dehydrogenase-like predicted oxidoreductase
MGQPRCLAKDVESMLNRLTIGTVQFGLPYGISQDQRQVEQVDIDAILDFCRRYGVRTLDTAIAYGTSELRLGLAGVRDFEVITKLPEVPMGIRDVAGWVESEVCASMNRLGVDKLKAILLHRPQQLLQHFGADLFQSLQDLRHREFTSQIGISVYSPEDLELVLSTFDVDVVQLPFNVVDRRFYDTGWFSQLKRLGVEIHVRSIFLQGLLLMNAANRPQRFARWNDLFDAWEQWLVDVDRNAVEACIRFVNSFSEIDRVVVGVHNAQQLATVVSCFGKPSDRSTPDLASCDTSLIDPSTWSLA